MAMSALNWVALAQFPSEANTKSELRSFTAVITHQHQSSAQILEASSQAANRGYCMACKSIEAGGIQAISRL